MHGWWISDNILQRGRDFWQIFRRLGLILQMCAIGTWHFLPFLVKSEDVHVHNVLMFEWIGEKEGEWNRGLGWRLFIDGSGHFHIGRHTSLHQVSEPRLNIFFTDLFQFPISRGMHLLFLTFFMHDSSCARAHFHTHTHTHTTPHHTTPHTKKKNEKRIKNKQTNKQMNKHAHKHTKN